MAPRSLRAVDLRDEAVRILREAVEAAQLQENVRVLQLMRNQGANWWDVARHVPEVVAFGAPLGVPAADVARAIRVVRAA